MKLPHPLTFELHLTLENRDTFKITAQLSQPVERLWHDARLGVLTVLDMVDGVTGVSIPSVPVETQIWIRNQCWNYIDRLPLFQIETT